MDIDMAADAPAIDSAVPDYPQPPFSFKSLPVELRAAVIETFSSGSSTASVELQEEDRATLFSLSLTDRECSKFALVHLWRHIIFHHRSSEALAMFLQHILPHRAALIKSADFGGPYARAPTEEQGLKAVREKWALWMAIVEGLTALREIDIKALPFTNPLLLITSPSLWTSSAPSLVATVAPTNTATGALTSLTLSGYPQPLLDGDALAVVLQRFPLLTTLSLTLIGPCHNGGFAPALKRLTRLRRLELRNVESVDGRLLEGEGWGSEFRELVVSDCTALSLDDTLELIRQLGPSLEVIDLLLEHAVIPPALNVDPSSEAAPLPSLAPIPLPRLTTLSVELTPSPVAVYSFLSAIQAPSLARFTLLHTSRSTPDLETLLSLVDRSKELQSLTMRVGRDIAGLLSQESEQEDGGSAARVHARCAERGVELDWEVV